MRFHLQLDPSRVPDGGASPRSGPAFTTQGCGKPPRVFDAHEGPARPGDTPVRLQLGLPAAAGPRAALPVLRSAVDPAEATEPTAAWFQFPLGDLGRLLLVPAGARVLGDVQAHAVWVAGEVTGRVTATGGVLVVDAGGTVRGGLDGQGAVVVAGRVRAAPGRAAIVARGRLDLAGTARVFGEVFHDVVALYEGARVDGGLRALSRR